MKNIIYFTFVLFACAVGNITAETKTCYFCVQEDGPVWTDCWNASDTLPTVECEHDCYTSMFQSGGNDLQNYWNVKRGCSDTCAHSENCHSQHFGACVSCCNSNLCNIYVNSPAVNMRINLSLVIMCLISVLIVRL